MSKHTPGPWQRSGVRQKLCDEDCIRVGPDGFAIAFLPIGRRPQEQAGAIADANLVAAAPDLLEALREMYSLVHEMGWTTPDNRYRTICNAASVIAKAEGA